MLAYAATRHPEALWRLHWLFTRMCSWVPRYWHYLFGLVGAVERPGVAGLGVLSASVTALAVGADKWLEGLRGDLISSGNSHREHPKAPWHKLYDASMVAQGVGALGLYVLIPCVLTLLLQGGMILVERWW